MPPAFGVHLPCVESVCDMKISWSWLNAYLDVDIDVNEAADILTSTGLEVEKIEQVDPVPGMLKGVVVGEVISCEKHPDADKLQITSVNIGQEEHLPIVCGAPNVAAGQKVLVATVGTILNPTGADPLKIKKAKIRGQESRGMICAQDELGLGTDHDGIMVLPVDAEVGMSGALHLGLRSEYAFEIGLTPNRADGMSHLGTARDLIAAINHRQERNERVLWPSVEEFKKDDDALHIPFEVKDEQACLRYTGLGLTDVKVGPSPEWIQARLRSIGLKSINNVVDITNFVQWEVGQPLHAFDADEIGGNKIVVRTLDTGTTFTTLDDIERKLDAKDLMICDADLQGMCIAGVFGGAKSGVTEKTTKVFLESALFDTTSIRKTAKRHGLHTDASFRFERGVDPDRTIYALKRAALLLKEHAGAKISSDVADHYPDPIKPFQVTMRYRMLDRTMGHQMNRDEIKSLLPLLDIKVTGETEEGLNLEIAPYRVDVLREIDVIEEIIRIHGFNRIDVPAKLSVPAGNEARVPMEQLSESIGAHWSSRGFSEIMTPSLVSAADVLAGGLVGEEELVKLSNPLSSELDVMRPDMIMGGLAAINYNVNRKNQNLRLFERGRVYTKKEEKEKEVNRFSLFLSGKHDVQIWRGASREVELADVKAELEMLLNRCKVGNLHVERKEHALLDNANEIKVGERVVAVFGTVKAALAKRMDVDQIVHFGEVNFEALLKLRRKQKLEFKTVSKYPVARRDLSVLIDKEVRFEELKDLAVRNEKKLLKGVTLLDRFEGNKLPDGKKSYCLTFTLQDEGQTLTDERIDKVIEKFFKIYEKEFQAERR